MLEHLLYKEAAWRKELFRQAKCSNISQYNTKVADSAQLPAVVVVFDEWADMMGEAVREEVAARLFALVLKYASTAGYLGFYLVICTQRPSVDLLPGSIRSLMNVRVAFKANDGKSSTTILDQPGAEGLLMRGDMLFLEENVVTRAQGYWQGRDALEAFLDKIKESR